ncbi:alpha/beta hydrolase [Vibrio cincinnatiensis]|uniref:alpha/beta hydrolase n=1 Tax=Vibrio cincinnatiensis TaxID=675 RepID=UPI001EDD736F|nr:alpha/beta hydrolase [Vibrio cincinnatiensis]MCG3723142.1 steryl acetyl hydrolase [Vibrio cincinnatiensis]
MLNQLERGIKELVENFIAEGKQCSSTFDIDSRRAGYLSSTDLSGSSPEMFEEFIDDLNGATLKVYKPSNTTGLPITIYFHGGCFISGGFKTHEQQLRQIASLSNSIVICIQYRLAPENGYPAAHDDVYNAVLAIKELGSTYGGDTNMIYFVGDSAGGQLALTTSLRLKQNQNWLPQKQILIYPMLDPFGKSKSYVENGTDYMITANMLLSGFSMYTTGMGKELITQNPELNPLECADFEGLPATYIITAEFDPLRDEGEQCYKQLLNAGVEAYCERYLGVIHGFHQLSGVSASARCCLRHISEEIKQTTKSVSR